MIKAQQYRTREKNKDDALSRLQALIQSVAITYKMRKTTKPTKESKLRRLDSKTKQGRIKALRGNINYD